MKARTYNASMPSNIAFLKYWGKADESRQWPTNNSLSMTLSECQSFTSCVQSWDLDDFEIYYQEKRLKEGSFFLKMKKHLAFLKAQGGFEGFLRIRTENNFPTASGVASSASGFGALTLSAVAAWTSSKNFEELEEKGYSRVKLSSLARLGSGSACRSFWGGFVLWKKGQTTEEQTCEPLSYEWALTDTLVILNSSEKKLSSTQAHRRVQSSPLFSLRLCELPKREKAFKEALSKRDFKYLGELLEQEALDIHSVIMTAQEPFSYLGSETVEFLCWLRRKRDEKAFQAYFTLDAGSNVHVICESEATKEFLVHLKQDFSHLSFICDQVGTGPHLSSSEVML